MDFYEELSFSEKMEYKKCIQNAEKRVAEIHAKALIIARKTNPKIDCVIDKYTIHDYWDRYTEKTGKWNFFFTYPYGIKNEEELVESIVHETLQQFDGN